MYPLRQVLKSLALGILKTQVKKFIFVSLVGTSLRDKTLCSLFLLEDLITFMDYY